MTISRASAASDRAGRPRPGRWPGAAPALVLVLVVSWHPGRAADGDQDLQLIPDAVLAPPATAGAEAPAAVDRRSRIYFEALPTATWWRATPVPLPPATRATLSQRLAVDGRTEQDLAPGLTATLSDRVNEVITPGDGHQILDTPANDLREGYLTWTPGDGSFVDVGRINVKTGAAMGFNPTDFFKTAAVVTRTSDDPTALRDNRLGTAMVRGQTVWETGGLSLIAAPGIGDAPDRWWTSRPGFGLGLDHTNWQNRWLARATVRLDTDLAPELLYYREGESSRAGFNLTRGIGDRVVTYFEWSGGRRAGLITEALADLRRTGTVPDLAPAPFALKTAESFRSQLAVGFSYTGDGKDTTNLEYDFNQNGLTGPDWRRWLAAGRADRAWPGLTGQLWAIRQFAQDQGEPFGRHSLFLRSDWLDALVPDLELTGLVDFSLEDGSAFTELAASYKFSDHITLGLTLSAALGAADSDSGSLPEAGSLMGTLRYDF